MKNKNKHKKGGILCAYLHGYNGDNLYLDSVEFVETTPAARLHQPREDPANGLVVLPVRTVDHHHVLRQILAQVLTERERAKGGTTREHTCSRRRPLPSRVYITGMKRYATFVSVQVYIT